MSLLPNLEKAATATLISIGGGANSNGNVIDLQPYKGPVSFVLAVGQSATGTGSVASANIETSSDNSNFDTVNGGDFTPVTNSANVDNIGVQVKTFDVRELSRYARVPLVISGTTPNVPVTVTVIGQKERV